MLSPMTKGGGRKPARRPSPPRQRTARTPAVRKRLTAVEDSFPDALAALLRSRKIRVPTGLTSAPPQAYASQPVDYVDRLANLSDAELRRYGEQIASYARKQAARARDSWESSPLIAELRKRRLPEPETPSRVVGASVSLAKPLKEWSDGEIVHAADEWSRMGSAW